MKIVKILNNNAVEISHGDQSHAILIGRGIGHQHHRGDNITKDEVDETFLLINPKLFPMMTELMSKVPAALIETCNEIVQYGRKVLHQQLNQTVLITLIDHLDYAIAKARDGIHTPNPINNDIKRFYPQEYQIGEYAIQLVQKNHYTQLSEDEAGFIAMHFVDATLDSEHEHNLNQLTKFIHETVEIVQNSGKVDKDTDSIAWSRFIRHVQFMAIRVLEEKELSEQADPEIQTMVFKKYPLAYHLAQKIQMKLQADFHVQIGNGELMYITMHISRLQSKEGHSHES